MSQAGDINGDGVDDVIIGADRAHEGSASGASYVVFGGAGVGSTGNLNLSALDGTNGFKLSGAAAFDYSGRSVSQAGDINGDGVDDVIIGAFGADPNGSYSGASYVVFGQASTPVDTTPPAITPNVSGTLGNNGWYTSDVTLSFTVTEAESPGSLTTSGCETVTISTDTTGQTFTCEASSDGGTASESVTVKRDATGPTLAPTVAPNPVTLNGAATASPNASDATSGIAVAGCNTVTTNSVGGHTVDCTATDQAGNLASASASYTVRYAFTGFLAPVDNPPVMNTTNAGQGIPLKWHLADANGVPVTNLASVTVTAVTLSCSLGTTTDQIEEFASGDSGLQNLGNGDYQFNWKTPKSYAHSCKTLKLNLSEGTGQERTAFFNFTK